jgi:diaminohydroxyphosphoribosylaminopyrimidine deaminase/5-amino-6-(5-phosphoribosylamino)uracil reductase
VGEGWHERAGGPHAEAAALAVAGDRARGATAYVSLEPCCHQGRTPPCTGALIRAGVVRVVFGARDPNPRVDGGGERALRSAGIAVEGGLMAAEAEALNPGFVSRMVRRRPLVRLKVAATLDGRTALPDGRSRWITGEPARQDVQRWRARSSAVLTGIGTVLADDPRLNVRGPAGSPPDKTIRQPLRVVADPSLRTPPGATLFREPGPVFIVGAAKADAEGRRTALESAGARVEFLGAGGRVDLAALMGRLAELEVNELWVEAGPTLNGALLEAGLVDELIIYLAPRVLGDQARGMFRLPPPVEVAGGPAFVLAESRAVGGDLRLIYRPAGGA